MLTKDGIRTLVDVVIANPTRAYLLRQSYTTQGFATSEATKAKERNYRDRHPTDHFFPFIIEMSICLNKQAYVFLHDCANVMWNFKG